MEPPSNPMLDRSAIVAILVRHAAAWIERKHKIEAKEGIEKEIAALNSKVADCEVALRVFGFDVSDSATWDAIQSTYGQEVRNVFAHPQHGVQDQPELLPTPTPSAQPVSRIQDLVLDALRACGDRGSKAAPIRNAIVKLHGPIHDKTVGMTLYRLLNKGLVRRSGHTWFFVPPDAETKNPGVGAPGSD
jgi:hypothetical protein